ncbi:MAG: glutathione transferase GstA, partial [Microvirga sp.]|nr:glutathione transferase GstA [Microvirga sp.]
EVGSADRYRVLEWIGFISTELHKGFSPLFKPDTPDAYKTIAIANLHRRLAYLDEALAGRSYLTGDRFTVADAYAFTILRWTEPLKVDVSDYKNIAAYMNRVGQREHVRQALRDEGLLKAA